MIRRLLPCCVALALLAAPASAGADALTRHRPIIALDGGDQARPVLYGRQLAGQEIPGTILHPAR